MSAIHFSELESARFDLNIHRGNLDWVDIEALKKYDSEYRPDVIIVRIPVTEQQYLHQLSELNKEVIFADTLVYYHIDIQQYQPKAIRNTEYIFKRGSIEDIDELRAVVPVIFEGYTNHYSSNPQLNKQKVSEGYSEWALSFLDGQNKTCFLLYDKNKLIAFANCSLHNEEAEGVLYGVLPEYSGKGIYSDLIRYTQSYFKNEGANQMEVSTQIQNYTVQRVWTREGFELSHAFNTIHLNRKAK